MFPLISDVGFRFVEQRRADAGSRVARLPLKPSGSEFLIAPLRRARFDELHGLGQRHRRWKCNQDMSVIVEASDRNRRDAVLPRNSRHERPEAWLHFRGDYLGAILCAEDAMHTIRNVGIRHGRDESMSIVPPGLSNLGSGFPALRDAPCRANDNRASGALAGA